MFKRHFAYNVIKGLCSVTIVTLMARTVFFVIFFISVWACYCTVFIVFELIIHSDGALSRIHQDTDLKRDVLCDVLSDAFQVANSIKTNTTIVLLDLFYLLR